MDESFDLDAFDPDSNHTISRVARKPRRVAYGRRGSEAQLTRPSLLSHDDPTSFGNELDEGNKDHGDLLRGEGIESTPSKWETSTPAKASSGSRKFTRSHCITGTTPNSTNSRKFSRSHSITGATPNFPRPPPLLKRSLSVSTTMSHNASSSHRSSSIGSSLSSLENFEPFNESLRDGTSPKRGAGATDDGQLGDTKQERKKTKPEPRNFLDNDFSSLVGNGDKSGERMPSFGSNHSSFSNLARHGNFGSGWAVATSPSQDTVPSLGTTSSRKRSSQDSPLSDEDGSTPPKARSRSKLSFTPVSMTHESPYMACMSAESKESHGGYGMDMSFFSPDKQQQDRCSPVLDMSMTDDEKNVTADESGDDASVDANEPFPSQITPAAVLTTIAPMQRLAPEHASVEDVIRSMPSYEDLRFLASNLAKGAGSSFSMRSISVPLPVAWKPERRAGFLPWTVQAFGFRYMPGGNKVGFVQIPKDRGGVLLDLLKRTVRACKEQGVGGASPSVRQSVSNFLVSPSKPVRRPPPICLESVPRSLNLATPKELTLNSLWNYGVLTPADDLAQRMQTLNMQEKPPRKSAGRAVTKSRLSIDSTGSEFSITRNPRPSLEHRTSNSDLMAHLHGSSTPVPRSRAGRPPRASLQSVASSTCKPVVGITLAASPFPSFRGIASVGSVDFALTPSADPFDSWGSRPLSGRDWGTSESIDMPFIGELRRRFLVERKAAGFTCDEEEEEGEGVASSLGLDFDAVSNYRDGPESPSSTTSRDNEDSEEDQQSQVLSQESVDFFGSYDTDPAFGNNPRNVRRRHTSMAKHRRMSLFASAVNTTDPFFKNRKSLFNRPSLVVAAGQPPPILETDPEFYRSTWTWSPKGPEKRRTLLEKSPLNDPEILQKILDFLPQDEILAVAGMVSTKWFDASAHSYANVMLSSVGCSSNSDDDFDDEFCFEEEALAQDEASSKLMERPWSYLTTTFPWASFLSEGAFKRVYKVFNRTHRIEEAVSVMDLKEIKSTGNMNVVGAELAVSVLLSSLVRRGVCPNFVVTRGAFSCPFEPPPNYWGDANNKRPRGLQYTSPKVKIDPKEPQNRGHYQYIRMELCDEGDAEEYLKRQPEEALTPKQARQLLFQISFAIHAAADRFSLKHYDVKLLNVFLKRARTEKNGDIVLRYGLGEHTFALRQSQDEALIAKLADYGTANVDSGSNGQQVTIAQFTTLENTPPDFLIMGDRAQQGHGHDNFGLGLCMLHLMTGHAPYEEIMEDVRCPDNLKRELRKLWENEDETDYSVVRSIILADVFMDEEGHILEGEPDEVLYDTLYKFLVLFGIPNDSSSPLFDSKAMKVIKATLSPGRGKQTKKGKGSKRIASDASKYYRDRRKYSLSQGNNHYIARAREALQSMDGGMDLLLSLVHFNPQSRATALDVLNATFMAPLREQSGAQYSANDEVISYTAFATHKEGGC